MNTDTVSGATNKKDGDIKSFCLTNITKNKMLNIVNINKISIF